MAPACLTGDIIAEFSLFALGWTLFRMPLYAEYAGDLLPASLFWRSLSMLRESQILAVPTSRRAEGA